jgi:hypothetical protein
VYRDRADPSQDRSPSSNDSFETSGNVSAVYVFACSFLSFGRTPKVARRAQPVGRELERTVHAGRERRAADDRALEDDVHAVLVGEEYARKSGAPSVEA